MIQTSLTIQIINPTEYPCWDDLLLTAERATFFHTSAWAQVLSESYGYKPVYFTIIENDKIGGLIPVMEINSFLTGKRGVSLPFSDICEPLAVDQKRFEALFKETVVYARQAGWKHIELRGGGCFLEHEPASAEYLVHTLELSVDESVVSRQFKPNIRRNIRKAEKEGVKVKFERSLKATAEFYGIHCSTRRHHGLPPQPWSFFKKIHEHLIAPGKGILALAEYQDRRVAGAIFAFYRDQMIYKFGASHRDFQHLRPNNLILWEAIRRCCRNGVRSFSFGRSEPKNNGLVQFKRGWGAAERATCYFKNDLRANAFVSGSPGLKSSYGFFKQMPESLLRLVGNMLYRHVG